jgi:hypothetical protein
VWYRKLVVAIVGLLPLFGHKEIDPLGGDFFNPQKSDALLPPRHSRDEPNIGDETPTGRQLETADGGVARG